MEGRQEITLDINSKGILVHAENDFDAHSGSYWLLLISHVKERELVDGTVEIVIYRHASFFNGLNYEWEGASENPENWGGIDGYKFYTVTEEEKNMIKCILKKKGFKYIKGINKLMQR